MKKSLIYLDKENIQNSIDLLEVVRQIYGDGKYETYGLSINQTCSETEGKFNFIINIHDEAIKSYDQMAMTDMIEELHKKFEFDSILIPATYIGRMLAPRLAMRLHVGLVADVTAINNKNGVIEMVRPAFSGKIMAGIINKGRVPIMMSVRQNVFSYTSTCFIDTRTIEFKPTHCQTGKINHLETREKVKSHDIRESEVLISGGGGMIDNFQHLYQLADELNAQVSASRRIIDSGIAPRSIQVGQSGKTVSPRLYMALGIYGSLQHIEGLKNVESIISVNTNKNAPICSLSDVVVEGDAIEFIEKLVKKIRNNK